MWLAAAMAKAERRIDEGLMAMTQAQEILRWIV